MRDIAYSDIVSHKISKCSIGLFESNEGEQEHVLEGLRMTSQIFVCPEVMSEEDKVLLKWSVCQKMHPEV